ncbi:hypothetical protein BC826DRAFT_1032988 [Russula brevipes]|nr:hypothetical protein BC826DRAFT_1032988 [Russula brevipes]
MHFLANSSSPSCIPTLDGQSTHSDGQDWFQGLGHDKADSYATTTQHTAGSMYSSPLPSSTSPPTAALDAIDHQLIALFNTDCSSNVYAGRYFGISNSDTSSNFGSQDSDLSSCYSTPPSSIASPLGNSVSPFPTSPGQLLHVSSSPFSIGAVDSQSLVAPIEPYQYAIPAWLQPTAVPCPTPPGVPSSPPTSPPVELTAASMPGVANQGLQDFATDNAGVPPGNFMSTSTHTEMTALGLYYSGTTQTPDVPLLQIEVEDNGSAPSAFERVPPTPHVESWKFQAVDPAKPPIKCDKCDYFQLNNKRWGDFRRHLKRHDADHLTRVVCCGVPPTHPGMTRLHFGHLTHFYDSRPFYGGCGRSYSRMDALQRHLKKSGCIGGTAKEHRSWRKLYFSDKTRCLHKPADWSVLSSAAQDFHVPSSSPEYLQLN